MYVSDFSKKGICLNDFISLVETNSDMITAKEFAKALELISKFGYDIYIKRTKGKPLIYYNKTLKNKFINIRNKLIKPKVPFPKELRYLLRL